MGEMLALLIKTQFTLAQGCQKVILEGDNLCVSKNINGCLNGKSNFPCSLVESTVSLLSVLHRLPLFLFVGEGNTFAHDLAQRLYLLETDGFGLLFPLYKKTKNKNSQHNENEIKLKITLIVNILARGIIGECEENKLNSRVLTFEAMIFELFKWIFIRP